MREYKFSIKGTHCNSCKRLIEKKIEKLEGILSVMVDFNNGNTEVVADRKITKEEIQSALEGTQYQLI
jgi:copper chaperone CopZ